MTTLETTVGRHHATLYGDSREEEGGLRKKAEESVQASKTNKILLGVLIAMNAPGLITKGGPEFLRLVLGLFK